MERRDFMKLAAMAGIAVVSPMGWSRSASAQSAPFYGGPYYVMLNATGGWDPTYLCDPKGVNGINRLYRQGDIMSPNSSNIRYAPIGTGAGSNKAFFEKYAKELLVLNGIDMATNSHFPGERYAWTGNLSDNSYPTFAALVAAAKAPDLPLSYLSYGGYDATGRLLPLSRITNATLIPGIANSNAQEGNSNKPYHSQKSHARIQRALQEKHEREHHKHHLPRIRQAMSTLFTAQLGSSELNRITQYLPAELPTDNPLKTQAAVAIAAFKAGLCVSVNMAITGFDTHASNDEGQLPRIATVLEGIDYVMERAAALGIREKIVVVAASDFGRTPQYNGGNGKDHWPITSTMILGNGVRGNRVIGGSDDGQMPYKINPNTLALDNNGIVFRPEHIHRALRRHAGIIDHDLSKAFDLPGEDLNLFG